MKTNQPKNVQKSIRISEDVLKYIEKQEGNGFNEKLCNMVLYFMEHEANIKKKQLPQKKGLKLLKNESLKKKICLKSLNLYHGLSALVCV